MWVVSLNTDKVAILFLLIASKLFAVAFTDHCVHYYDLRNTKQPIMVFKGHRKAVSYAKFVNGEEIVSAWVLFIYFEQQGVLVSFNIRNAVYFVF